MRIGIDLRFTSESGMGTGVYSETAALDIAEACTPDDDVVCILPHSVKGPAHSKITNVGQPQYIDITRSLFTDRLFLQQFIAAKGIDVFFSPAGIIPRNLSCPCVVTIHDLLFERNPEFFNPALHTYLKHEVRRSAETARCIVAVSEHTKLEITRHYSVDETKIFVARQRLRYLFASKPKDQEICYRLKELGIERPYVLILSNHAPHKNSTFAIEAFSKWASQTNDTKHTLVIAGGGYAPNKPTNLDTVLQRYQLPHVKLLSMLPTDALPALYAGASLFLFPSLYEGWGLPPLEAIAMDTPSVTSDCGAIPEAVEAAARVLPLDHDQWVSAIDQILTNGPEKKLLDSMAARAAELLKPSSALYNIMAKAAESEKHAVSLISGKADGPAGISGCTIVRSGVKLRYPLRESIQSYAAICDEVIVAYDPTSNDGTTELVEALKKEIPKIKLIESIWDLSNKTGGHEIARQTNYAFKHCSKPWILYVQADEAIHEAAHDEIRHLTSRKTVGAIAFQRASFLHTLDAEIPEHRVSGLFRLFRNGAGKSVGDAMQCEISPGCGELLSTKLQLFNYSRLGEKAEVAARSRNLHSFYHPDDQLVTVINNETEYSSVPFVGPHPRPIEDVFRKARVTNPGQTPRVSVHMIGRESDSFGAMMIDAALDALHGYADELIIVDNGLSEEALNVVHRHMQRFSSKLITSHGDVDFSYLRNLALDSTAVGITHVQCVDTDEVYYTQQLCELKEQLKDTRIDGIATMRIHFMIEPGLVAMHHPMRHVFKYSKTLRWVNNVHENMSGVGRNIIESPCPYLHFGYCRPQWQIFLKWLNYCFLQEGSLFPYKYEYLDGVRLPFFRDGKTPNTVMDIRRPHLAPFAMPYPESCRAFLSSFSDSQLSWSEWVNRQCDGMLWQRWQELRQQVGNWEGTLDQMLELAFPKLAGRVAKREAPSLK